MKKSLALVICLVLLLTFTACGDNATESNVKLTSDEALNIALAEAEVLKDDISALRTKLEADDGIYVYEIDFNVRNTEYSYDINANTGEIVEREQDAID